MMAAPELGLDARGSPPGARELRVIHSVISPSAVLRTIARAYRIPAPAQCTLVRPGLNDTYLLESPAGRFIVRVYGARHRSRPEVGYELDLLGHLRRKGVSVSNPMPSADGAFSIAVAGPEGSRRLAVFTYAPGRPISWANPEHCLAAGRLAAEVHDGADDFVTTHARPALDLLHMVDEPLHAVRPFLTHRPDALLYLSRLAARLRGRAAAAIEDRLDWGACHGDLEAKNFHVCDGRLIVFDFDLCGPGWRLYDFTPIYGATRVGAMREGWNAFLRGYQERRSLRPVDIAAVPLLRVLRQLAMLGAFATNAQRWGASVLDDASLNGWLALIASLEKQVPEGGRPRAALRPRTIVRRADDVRPRLAHADALPVVWSLLDPAALASELEQSYPTGAVRCALLHRGLNDTYFVTTPGEGDRYVARVYRQDRHPAAVTYELELLAHLARRGVPVASVVPAHDGGELVEVAAPEGRRLLTLFARAPGAPLSWDSEDHARILGTVAARIHTGSDDFRADHPHRAIDLEHLIDRPLAALAPHVKNRQRALLRAVATDLRARMKRAAVEGLDRGPCHGDLRPEQVRIGADGTATVFGFDRCGLGWRAYDFAIVRWGSQGREDHSFWHAFLAGYAEVRPLRAVDRAAASALYVAHRLWALGLRAENAARWGTRQIGNSVIDEELAFFGAWHEQQTVE